MIAVLIAVALLAFLVGLGARQPVSQRWQRHAEGQDPAPVAPRGYSRPNPDTLPRNTRRSRP